MLNGPCCPHNLAVLKAGMGTPVRSKFVGFLEWAVAILCLKLVDESCLQGVRT